MTLSLFHKRAGVTDMVDDSLFYFRTCLRQIREAPTKRMRAGRSGWASVTICTQLKYLKFHLQCNHHSFLKMLATFFVKSIYKICLNHYFNLRDTGSLTTLHCTMGPNQELIGQNRFC